MYSRLLFGLLNAVASFNRYAKLCETLVRRLLIILYSMYSDDASIQDWASTEGRGQIAVRQLNALLGTPFAPLKQQDMSSRGDFLGLEHDISSLAQTSTLTVWARGRIVD